MNESNGRKTLISVKVSTLLLILLVIIVLIVIGIVIANQTKKNNDEINNTKVTNTPREDSTVGNIIGDNSQDTQEENDSSYRDSSVSSRSSAPREKIQVVLSDKENVEIIHEKEPEPEPEPEVVTTPIEEVTISKDMDLTVRTGLSRDDFIKLISGVEQDTSNFFEENAGLIYDLCEKYGLNEIFFCGLISAESGWTIASSHRSAHNYISLMSGKGLIKYDSVESGLEKAAETLHNNYLYPGGKFYYGPTLAGMKTRFCPASSTWVNLVYQRMAQILN